MYVLSTENKKDNRKDIYGKILLKANKEKQKVTFSQFASDVNLYTEIDREVEEDFELVMPTIQVCNLIKLFPETAQLEFTKEGIKFKNNKYSFEKEEITFPEIIEYVEMYKNSIDVVTITDLNKFNKLKSFVGSYETNTDAIMCSSGNFITKNIDIISSSSTKNDKDLLCYFSKIFINLITSNKFDGIKFKKFALNDDINFSSIKIDNTYVFMVDQTYIIPNIFEEKFVSHYDHKSKIEIPRIEFLNALSRIKVKGSQLSKKFKW
jgi:hypothetical protein